MEGGRLDGRVDEYLTGPLKLTEAVRKSLEEADSFKQECHELLKKVENLSKLLRKAFNVGPGNLYGRPQKRIMADVEKTLDKALTLAKKCRRSGMLKRVITITSVADFKRCNIFLENSIGDVTWLLNVSAVGQDRPEYTGVPPIAINDPVLAVIWEEIAVVQVGSLEVRADSAENLANYAKGNERNCKLIIDEGGLPPLLRLLREGNIKGQEAAAYALGVLARDSQRVTEILEERSAVDTFIQVLTNGSMKAQVKTAWALAQMVSQSKEAQDQFAANGAIRLLVSLLAYDTIEDTKGVPKVGSIHTIVKSQLEKSKTGVGEYGTPAKPVDGEDASSDTESKGVALKPGDSGSHEQTLKKPLSQESSRLGPGPVKPISGLGKPTGFAVKGNDLRTNSSDFRTSPESRSIGHSQGHGSNHSHGHTRHRLERDREDPETKQMLKAEAAHALWKLAAGNVKNSKSITDTRALLCFAKLIESGEGDVQMNSVMAVMEIAMAAEKDPELRRAAFKTNSPAAKAVVLQLLKVIEDGEPELQAPCIRAIGCLARIFPAPAQHVLRPLTAQLANNGAVAEEAAKALRKFANKENYLHMEHSRTILEYSGAGHLVQLIYFERQAEMEALILLSYLALNVGDSDALEKAASLQALEAATRWPNLPEDVRMLLVDAIQHLELYQQGSRAPPEGANFLV